MNKALAATELLLALLTQAARISEILRIAHGEERDLDDDEWTEVLGDNDEARARLELAIRNAGEAER